MQLFLELTDPHSVKLVILVEDPTRLHFPRSLPDAVGMQYGRSFSLSSCSQDLLSTPHCDGRCVVVPAETSRVHGRTALSVLVHVSGTQMLVEQKNPFLRSICSSLGCTSDFVCNCLQNEGDTRASESTNVGTDEDLNDGSNNGASIRGRSRWHTCALYVANGNLSGFMMKFT